MAVKIRLSRTGKKHVPFYNIVAVDGRKKRDGAYLESLGTYDALKNSMVLLHQDRIDYWLSVGAVPTDAFLRIAKRHKKNASEAQSAETPAKKEKAPKASKKKHEES